MGFQPVLIGDLAAQTGCKIETIRYYERIALLPKAARRGRYRIYDAQDVARVRFIRRARELGFSIDDIRALIRLSDDASSHCGDVREVAALHLTQVRTRIADLKRVECVLAQTVKACDTGVHEGCPLIDSLSMT